MTSGSALWAVQGSTVHTGAYAAQSGAITDNGETSLSVVLNVTSPGDVSFWYKVSSEARWDILDFRIDGSLQKWDGYSGEINWTQEKFPVTAGVHKFEWIYSKDSTVSQGSDAAWVDDIFFPPSDTLIPDPSVAPSPSDFGNQPAGITSAARTFTVSNTGTGSLVIGTVFLSGTNPGDFLKENDNCSGQTVLPSGDCTIDVKFRPLSVGARSADLEIPTNYPELTTAALSGTGTASYTLTVNKTGSTGTGTVTSLPAGINCGTDCTELYAGGTPVTLTPAADANSIFAGWSGGGCSGTGTCALTMNAATTVTAVFNVKPPVADFSGLPVTGDALLTVAFTDTSANTPTFWSWTFGDGGTSSLQNPSHTYENPGVYTVSLIAANAGGLNEIIKNGYITVTSLPVRIPGSPPSYSASLQTAYNSASEGAAVQARAEELTGDLDCNRAIAVTLKGGYDSLFTGNTGYTTISGALTITYGTVTVENMAIQ